MSKSVLFILLCMFGLSAYAQQLSPNRYAEVAFMGTGKFERFTREFALNPNLAQNADHSK